MGADGPRPGRELDAPDIGQNDPCERALRPNSVLLGHIAKGGTRRRRAAPGLF